MLSKSVRLAAGQRVCLPSPFLVTVSTFLLVTVSALSPFILSLSPVLSPFLWVIVSVFPSVSFCLPPCWSLCPPCVPSVSFCLWSCPPCCWSLCPSCLLFVSFCLPSCWSLCPFCLPSVSSFSQTVCRRGSQFFLKMCAPFVSLLVSTLFRWPCSISIHVSPFSAGHVILNFTFVSQL